MLHPLTRRCCNTKRTRASATTRVAPPTVACTLPRAVTTMRPCSCCCGTAQRTRQLARAASPLWQPPPARGLSRPSRFCSRQGLTPTHPQRRARVRASWQSSTRRPRWSSSSTRAEVALRWWSVGAVARAVPSTPGPVRLLADQCTHRFARASIHTLSVPRSHAAHCSSARTGHAVACISECRARPRRNRTP